MSKASDLSSIGDVLLQAFQPVEQTLGLPLLLALAAVASKPGLSVNELAERIEVPQQTASRYVAALQGRYTMIGRELGPVGLLKIEVSPEDPRRRALHLTSAGKTQLLNAFRSIKDLARAKNG